MLLHALGVLREAGRIPALPVVVDSPMALACLEVYREAIATGWPEIRDGLSESDLRAENVVQVRTAEGSMRWNDARMPAN